MMAREVVARIRKLLLILCDPLYRGALRYGLGAGTEHQKVIGSCECRMVVDIGANPLRPIRTRRNHLSCWKHWLT
jgi:hypothetical protein